MSSKFRKTQKVRGKNWEKNLKKSKKFKGKELNMSNGNQIHQNPCLKTTKDNNVSKNVSLKFEANPAFFSPI